MKKFSNLRTLDDIHYFLDVEETRLFRKPLFYRMALVHNNFYDSWRERSYSCHADIDVVEWVEYEIALRKGLK